MASAEALCVGDSTTFCPGVSDPDTWPEQFARRLSARTGIPWKSRNRAVEGYSGLQVLRVLRKELGAADRPKPTVVIYHFCLNDPVENLTDRPGIPRLIRSGADWTEAAGEPRPEGAQPSYRTRVRRQLQASLALSALARWKLQDTSAHAYCEGAQEAIEGTELFARRFLEEPNVASGMAHVVAALVGVAREHRVPIYVSLHPRSSPPPGCSANEEQLVSSAVPIARANDRMRAMVVAAGGQLLDCEGVLPRIPLLDQAVSPSNWHLSASGNAVLADCLAEKLAEAAGTAGRSPGTPGRHRSGASPWHASQYLVGPQCQECAWRARWRSGAGMPFAPQAVAWPVF